MKTVIIGVGTGRCGTMSLAKLINGCTDVDVTHEMSQDGLHYLPWIINENKLKLRMQQLEGRRQSFVGDVGLYYLNYLGHFFEKYKKNLKVVYIYRDKVEVLTSFLIKTERKNHWNKNEEGYWVKDKWDDAFPKFDVFDKRKAIEEYCNLYEQRMQKLMAKYPDQIFSMSVRRLNDKDKQAKLFDFIGIPEENRLYNIYHENKLYAKN